jgi:hypothetical protein
VSTKSFSQKKFQYAFKKNTRKTNFPKKYPKKLAMDAILDDFVKHFQKPRIILSKFSQKEKPFLFIRKTPQVSCGLHLKTCATQEKVRPVNF